MRYINLGKYSNEEEEKRQRLFVKILSDKGKKDKNYGIDVLGLAVLVKGRWYPVWNINEKVFDEIIANQEKK